MELLIISSREKLEQYRDDWSLILEKIQNTNPFIEYDWVNEWWKHLGENKQVEIIGVRIDKKMVAFFPFLYEKGLLGYKYYFMSFGQSNYMDIVAYDDLLDRSITYVLDEIIRMRKNVVFYLHGLLESSNTTASLEKYFGSRNTKYTVHRVITPFIDLKKIKLEEYMEKRRRLHRLDRREKRLHENGKVEFLRSSPEEMDYIFKIHDKRWEKRRDTSGFTNEKEKNFYRSLAKITSGALKTQIDSLYINDTMIAFNYGFNCRGRYLGYVLGYDDDFETFSPGRILEKEKILQCKYENERVFDLSIGYESYKFEWNTDLDFTSRIIFSSNTISSKVIRNWLSMKEAFIERIKKNHKLVLFIRKTIGKLLFIIKNMFKTESKGARSEVIDYIRRIRKYFYENERFLVYKMEKKNVPDFPESEEFVELTINDAMKCPEIVSIHMKDICRKMYGGCKGYYPKDNLAYENIFWTNDKVLRIDRISYLEQFKKSSVFFNNWNEGNLSAICSSVKKNSKARTVYVAIEEGEKTEKALLEEIGFSVSKLIFKKTYFGFKKFHIIE